ncbi:hypothetical protein AOLI_G00078680 [Acnodon oligacanthus]
MVQGGVGKPVVSCQWPAVLSPNRTEGNKASLANAERELYRHFQLHSQLCRVVLENARGRQKGQVARILIPSSMSDCSSQSGTYAVMWRNGAPSVFLRVH